MISLNQIIVELYRIQSMIPLTPGMDARERVRDLIDKVEEKEK